MPTALLHDSIAEVLERRLPPDPDLRRRSNRIRSRVYPGTNFAWARACIPLTIFQQESDFYLCDRLSSFTLYRRFKNAYVGRFSADRIALNGISGSGLHAFASFVGNCPPVNVRL